MTVKQRINHGAIQKVCHLHNGIFHYSDVSHFLSFTLSSPWFYLLKITNYRMRGKKFFVHIAASAYHFISEEVENRVFRHNRIFRYMYV